MASNPSAFLVFVKYPTPGRVKTRLARVIGEASAVRLYRAMAETCLMRMRNVEQVDCTVYFDPPEEENAFRLWLGADIHYLPQCSGDLGARLRYGMETLLERHERVIALGTDSPDLPVEYIREAIRKLDTHDVVLGPSEDGGYCLIGLSMFLPNLFEDIPWSTERVLDTTLRRCEEIGGSVHLLPPWYDVDEVEDLRRLARSTAPDVATLAREIEALLRIER